ncbi:hypothetical protein PAF17_03640 [Paracoccus sp. Z330]|uniref:Uncharacterized protein n=1 Tax=Paracoccus onchidii TaxID=3017813 RepID=A0ABT4ZB63_9RHOB|nr:hypothetical protein [Paracoccus onchidii]MDB6176594.1 hypothetical protein [Paracoccus onchidii]
MTNVSASADNRLALRIFAVLLVVLLVVAALVATFGLPVLGLIGLVLTLAVFVVMLAFTAGN